jgi:hypothetical protein
MTEKQWLVSQNVTAMAKLIVRGGSARRKLTRPSDRKLRLIICACARALWKDLNAGNRGLVARQEARPEKLASNARDAGWWPLLKDLDVSLAVKTAVNNRGPQFAQSAAALLREVAGNPYRPVIVAPSWLNADVLRLAQGAYDESRFDDLPILADALEDAGCADEALLSHLRSAGPHVRGCWALDLILGKE